MTRRSGEPTFCSARSTNDGPGGVPCARTSAGRIASRRRTSFVCVRGSAVFECPESVKQEALVALVSEDPGDTAAWERLAELALSRGDAAEAERFRRRKADVIALTAKYSKLVDQDPRTENAGELARLAEALGRKEEARGWSLVMTGRRGPATA